MSENTAGAPPALHCPVEPGPDFDRRMVEWIATVPREVRGVAQDGLMCWLAEDDENPPKDVLGRTDVAREPPCGQNRSSYATITKELISYDGEPQVVRGTYSDGVDLLAVNVEDANVAWRWLVAKVTIEIAEGTEAGRVDLRDVFTKFARGRLLTGEFAGVPGEAVCISEFEGEPCSAWLPDSGCFLSVADPDTLGDRR